MPTWSTRDELVHHCVTLCRQGLTRRAIARALDVSRNTVRKVLEAHGRARREQHEALVASPPRAPRETKLTAFEPRVAELLERHPEITAQRVFEELVAVGYTGGYTAVKVHVRRVRPRPRTAPAAAPPTHGPGEMAESDWSPYTVELTSGRRIVVQALGYVLCFSRRKCLRFYEHADFFALLDGHVAAFERFGGAARVCKYDNQKAVVLRWEGSQPIYNPRFLAFATHYEFRPRACRPRRPNDKPKVERTFWQLERSFFNGRSFRDIEDMRAQLAAWERNICDVRPHKKLRRTALEMFAEEQPYLVPLPSHPYDTARVVYRLCSVDGFVSWDGNRYAVPYEHVTDILPVRITQRELMVYAADLRCVARHELAPRSAGLDVDPQGIHPPWNRRGADREQLRATFAAMGEHAAAFYAALETAMPRHCGYHARQILQLRERYCTEDVCGALRHVLGFGAFEHQAVARVLAARAAPRTLDEYVAEDAARRLEDRLGADDTRPRDLDEYDSLPVAAGSSPQETTPCPDAHPTSSARSSSDSDDTSF